MPDSATRGDSRSLDGIATATRWRVRRPADRACIGASSQANDPGLRLWDAEVLVSPLATGPSIDLDQWHRKNVLVPHACCSVPCVSYRRILVTVQLRFANADW